MVLEAVIGGLLELVIAPYTDYCPESLMGFRTATISIELQGFIGWSKLSNGLQP